MRRNIEIYGDFKLCPIFMCKAVKQYEEYACLFKAVHFLQRRKGGWGVVHWDGDICFTNH